MIHAIELSHRCILRTIQGQLILAMEVEIIFRLVGINHKVFKEVTFMLFRFLHVTHHKF